jgi:hypothetical protein
MKFEDHCARTKELIGLEMPEVHKYIDKYYPYFRSTAHWGILHHAKGVDHLVDLFGKNYGYEGSILVRIAAEKHILDDIGYIPKDLEELENELFFYSIEEQESFTKLFEEEYNGKSE